MANRRLPVSFCVLLFAAVPLSAADVIGAQQIASIRVTPQLAGVALPRSARVYIWAIGLSPDEKLLAIGAAFSAERGRVGLSYYDVSRLLVVSVDSPSKGLKEFDIAPQASMGIPSQVSWSADGRFILVPF